MLANGSAPPRKVAKFFNTAGPCKPELHYMLPTEIRMPEVRPLIQQQSYFVLHAPRQMGKTTSLLALAAELNHSASFAAVLVSAEVGAPFGDDIGAAEFAMLEEWRTAAETSLPAELWPPPWPDAQPGGRIGTALRVWAERCYRAGRPLVGFIDEIDALQEKTLVSVLRQLRAGYPRRPQASPQSIGLIGMRDVRDYKLKAGGSDRTHTASPFNVKVESLTLRNFNQAETTELLLQHTRETGQRFDPLALARVFELTQGQPWLVNALARQLVEFLVRDHAQPITRAHVERAKEILIQRQDTHLDSLAERLKEDRVRRIIEPILAGTMLDATVSEEDQRFILDLGLCRLDPRGGLVIANPIYQEVIPRVLASTAQNSIRLPAQPVWLDGHGKLAPENLLSAFLDFWREHGEALLKTTPYHEVAPQLVLMAFLHRVVNGGGSIQREYAIGTRRMDLCVRHGDTVLGIELKVWQAKKADPLGEGLKQLDEYLQGLGQDHGWLVLFDRRPRKPALAKRLSARQISSPGGRQITVIRA